MAARPEDTIFFGLSDWNPNLVPGYELDHDKFGAGKAVPTFFPLPPADLAELSEHDPAELHGSGSASSLSSSTSSVSELRIRASQLLRRLSAATTVAPPPLKEQPVFSIMAEGMNSDRSSTSTPTPTSTPTSSTTTTGSPNTEPPSSDLSDFDWNEAYQILAFLTAQRPHSLSIRLGFHKLIESFEREAARAVSRSNIFALLAEAAPESLPSTTTTTTVAAEEGSANTSATTPTLTTSAGKNLSVRPSGVYHHRESNLLVQCATSFTLQQTRFVAGPWASLLDFDVALESKMAGHHLQGIRACSAQTKVAVPLLAVVDFSGHRFYVTSRVLLSRADLRTPSFNPSSLPLAPHLISHHIAYTNADVCFARPTPSAGGTSSSDPFSRPLMWNLARLLPPQAVQLETSAVLVPSSAHSPVVAKTLDFPNIGATLLGDANASTTAAIDVVSFAGLQVHFQRHATDDINDRVSSFLGFQVRGPAVITPAAASAHLWSRVRPEHIESSVTQALLSPDAFSQFGSTITDEAHQLCNLSRESATRLFEVSIPRCISFIIQSFSDWMHMDPVAGELKETSSSTMENTVFFAATISDLAHQFGINSRYMSTLGIQLLRRTPNPRFFANVVLTEITARVVKTLVRAHASKADLQAPAVNDSMGFLRFYNEKMLSSSFWQTSVKLHPSVYRFLEAFCTHFALGNVHTCDPRGMIDVWSVVQRAFMLLYKTSGDVLSCFGPEARSRVNSRETLRPGDVITPNANDPAASLRVRLSLHTGDLFNRIGESLIERAEKKKERVNRDWLLALASHFSLRALLLRVRHHDGPARLALVRTALAGARRQLHRHPHDPDTWTLQGQCFLVLASTRMKSRHLIDDPHQPFDPYVFDDLRFPSNSMLTWDDGPLQTPSTLLRRAMICGQRALLLHPAHQPALTLMRGVLRLARLDLPLHEAAKLLAQEHILASESQDATAAQQPSLAGAPATPQHHHQQQQQAGNHNAEEATRAQDRLSDNKEFLEWGAQLFVQSITAMQQQLQVNPHDGDVLTLTASNLDALRQLAISIDVLSQREHYLRFISQAFEHLLSLPFSSKSLRAFVLTGMALTEHALSRLFTTSPQATTPVANEVTNEQISQWQLLGRATYHLYEALCSSDTPFQQTIEASLLVVAYWTDVLPKLEKLLQMKHENQGTLVDQIIVWKDVIAKSKRKYLAIIDWLYQRGVSAFYKARQEWSTSEHRAHRSFLTAHQSLRRCLEFQTNPAVTKAVATNLYTWSWKLICAARLLEPQENLAASPPTTAPGSPTTQFSTAEGLRRLRSFSNRQVLGDLPKLTLQEVDCVFEIATNKLDKAIKVHGSCAEAHYNYGLALYFQSKKHKEISRIRGLVQRASERYARATELKLDYHQAWFNWGVSLDELAETEAAFYERVGEPQQSKIHPVLSLYYEAASHYCSALKSKPNKLEALTNLGQIFIRIATHKQSSQSDKLKMFRRVRGKYSEIRHIVQSQCSAAFNVEFKMQHARAMLNDPEDDPYAAEAAGMRVAHPLPFKGKTGFLYKRGQVVKNWKRRWFKLDAVNLEYHRDDSNGTTIKGRIPLRDIVGVHESETPSDEQGSHLGGFFFEVVCLHQRVLLIRAASEEDRSEWVSTIEAYIQ